MICNSLVTRAQTFAATFGGNQTMLEALTVKRRIMGSQWLFLTQPTRVTGSACQSWCKVEVTLSSAKHIGEHRCLITARVFSTAVFAAPITRLCSTLQSSAFRVHLRHPSPPQTPPARSCRTCGRRPCAWRH